MAKAEIVTTPDGNSKVVIEIEPGKFIECPFTVGPLGLVTFKMTYECLNDIVSLYINKE